MTSRPRVLITNDDGPPSPESSPFVYPFARAVEEQLGWDVRVVVPSSQRSWVSNSYYITQTIYGSYFCPKGPNGYEGEKMDIPKSKVKEGERAPWILVDGTPASCTNLALYSLFPPNSFDLVIAGPNFGRNTGTAFALSSGTIGSAMAASISGVPAIALSFGLMTGHKPPSDDILAGAVTASCKVVKQLWESGWTSGDKKIVYSVNVPLLPEMTKEVGPDVHWTTLAQTSYHRLFKSVGKEASGAKDTGGPAALPEPEDENERIPEEQDEDTCLQLQDEHHQHPLKFVFSPDISALVNPSTASLKAGTDTHTLHQGAISVTPIRASFEPCAAPEIKWRL